MRPRCTVLAFSIFVRQGGEVFSANASVYNAGALAAGFGFVLNFPRSEGHEPQKVRGGGVCVCWCVCVYPLSCTDTITARAGEATSMRCRLELSSCGGNHASLVPAACQIARFVSLDVDETNTITVTRARWLSSLADVPCSSVPDWSRIPSRPSLTRRRHPTAVFPVLLLVPRKSVRRGS